MRIAINLLSSKAGSALALNKYFLPALAGNDTANEYLVIVSAEQTKLIAAIPESFQKQIVTNLTQNYLARVLWEQLVLPIHLRRWKVDALYTLGNTTSLLAGCDRVVVVTNAKPFSSLRLEQDLKERFKLFLLRSFSILSARRASKLIFISGNSRDLICRRFGFPINKTEVIYYGWTPFPELNGQPPYLSSEYVLTVSVLWPYKNIERLMKAFELLVERHGFSGSLVIAGSIGSQAYYDKLISLRETLAHGERIVLTGSLGLEEIASLYKRARLFMLPSVEETLGLPLQEAMGAGIPIAAADCSLEKNMEHCFNPFREICREAADYFNPFDEESICESMHRVLSDTKHRERLVACGLERVKSFSWELMARQTIDVFATLK